jgi:hypothetical protein
LKWVRTSSSLIELFLPALIVLKYPAAWRAGLSLSTVGHNIRAFVGWQLIWRFMAVLGVFLHHSFERFGALGILFVLAHDGAEPKCPSLVP